MTEFSEEIMEEARNVIMPKAKTGDSDDEDSDNDENDSHEERKQILKERRNYKVLKKGKIQK